MYYKQQKKKIKKILKKVFNKKNEQSIYNSIVNCCDGEYDLMGVVQIKLEQMFYFYKNHSMSENLWLMSDRIDPDKYSDDLDYLDTKILNSLDNFDAPGSKIINGNEYFGSIWLGNVYIDKNQWYSIHLEKSEVFLPSEDVSVCNWGFSVKHIKNHKDEEKTTYTLSKTRDKFDSDKEFLKYIKERINKVLPKTLQYKKVLHPSTTLTHGCMVLDFEDLPKLSKEFIKENVAGKFFDLKKILHARKITKKIYNLDGFDFYDEKELEKLNRPEDSQKKLELCCKYHNDFLNERKRLYEEFSRVMVEDFLTVWD